MSRPNNIPAIISKVRIPTLLIIALVIITALVAYHYKRRAISGGADDIQEPYSGSSGIQNIATN